MQSGNNAYIKVRGKKDSSEDNYDAVEPESSLDPIGNINPKTAL